MTQTLAQIVRQTPGNLPAYSIFSMEELVQRSTAQRRFLMWLVTAFAVAGLVLAGIGLYGAISQSMAQRTREIGLRMALGAQLSDVQKLILKQGMFLAAIGSLCGLLIAFGGAGMMKSMLYGVSTSDPITFTCVALLLFGTALVACWIPARRASRVEPMIALRAE